MVQLTFKTFKLPTIIRSCLVNTIKSCFLVFLEKLMLSDEWKFTVFVSYVQNTAKIYVRILGDAYSVSNCTVNLDVIYRISPSISREI